MPQSKDNLTPKKKLAGKNFKRYVLYTFMSLSLTILFLVSFEGGLRLYSFIKTGKNVGIHRPSPCCGYRVKANNDTPPYLTDDHGFRKTPLTFQTKPPETVYKIVTMGDSITFGGPNANLLHYPAYLEYILNTTSIKPKLPDGKLFVDVINAGVISYTSLHLLKYLQHVIIDLNPDMVIISIGANDQTFNLNSPASSFFLNNVPLLYWYFNFSATVTFLRKALAPLTSEIMKHSRKPLSNMNNHVARVSQTFAYTKYENNLRSAVTLLKEREILPVLMPWPQTPGTDKANEFQFEKMSFKNDLKVKQYLVYAGIMKKIAKDFDIPLVHTPFQLPLLPTKHHAHYFMASDIHLNNAGAKIVGYTLGKAISLILQGKNNEEIYSHSAAAVPGLDLMDLHTEILLEVETGNTSKIQSAIINHAGFIADYNLKNRKDDGTLSGLHFSEGFFATTDSAFYLLLKEKYSVAKLVLDHVLKQYPKFAYAYWVYGLYYQKLNQKERAIYYFKKAIELAPFYKTPEKYLSKIQPALLKP